MLIVLCILLGIRYLKSGYTIHNNIDNKEFIIEVLKETEAEYLYPNYTNIHTITCKQNGESLDIIINDSKKYNIKYSSSIKEKFIQIEKSENKNLTNICYILGIFLLFLCIITFK